MIFRITGGIYLILVGVASMGTITGVLALIAGIALLVGI